MVWLLTAGILLFVIRFVFAQAGTVGTHALEARAKVVIADLESQATHLERLRRAESTPVIDAELADIRGRLEQLKRLRANVARPEAAAELARVLARSERS